MFKEEKMGKRKKERKKERKSSWGKEKRKKLRNVTLNANVELEKLHNSSYLIQPKCGHLVKWNCERERVKRGGKESKNKNKSTTSSRKEKGDCKRSRGTNKSER